MNNCKGRTEQDSIHSSIMDVINSMSASTGAATPPAASTAVSRNNGVGSRNGTPTKGRNGSAQAYSSLQASTEGMMPIQTPAQPPPGHHFVPTTPIYAASGQGRRILIYDSKSHPGHRREFAYKTRFTNRSGQTTVYYRCMACRSLKHRLQRLMWGSENGPVGTPGSAGKGKSPANEGGMTINGEKIPGVPCIAVKNDLLINDPDYPDANHHFCKP